jgi:hypothetical protein
MANANRKNQNHQPVTKKGRLNEMDTPFLHTTLDITKFSVSNKKCLTKLILSVTLALKSPILVRINEFYFADAKEYINRS